MVRSDGPSKSARMRARPRLPALPALPIAARPHVRHALTSPGPSNARRSPSTPPAIVWPPHAHRRPTLDEITLTGASMPREIDGYASAVDADTSSVFLYGGYQEPSGSPVGDLWHLNLSTYQWVNRTNELSSLDDLKYNPKAPEESMLPILRGPCMTYSVVSNMKLLFIAGAHTFKPDHGQYVAHQTDLIAVDLERKVFWDATPRNGAIKPRMDAAMTIQDGYLYLFGGTDIAAGRDDIYNVMDSYCIARFLPQEKYWIWVVKDQPYGQTVPSLGYSMGMLPIFRGTKLALFPGNTRKTRIDITGRDIAFFDTRERKFSVQSSTPGTFPLKCFRYGLGSPGSPPMNAEHLNECIYIATWTTDPPEADTVSVAWDIELWEYKLPPEQNFRPLHLTSVIDELDFDPEEFYVVGHRLIFLGAKISTMGAQGSELNTCVEVHLP